MGIEVTPVKDGIVLTQKRYIGDLLYRANMKNCKLVTTSKKLSILDGEPLSTTESTRYKSIVGGLKYLTLIRPDIAFSVNKVCQFLHSPTSTHMTAVKQILRYLKFSPSTGLKIRKSVSTLISAFSDDRRCKGGLQCFLVTT